MSNEIRTYQYTVTLPDTAGEEADVVAGEIEEYIRQTWNRHASVDYLGSEEYDSNIFDD